MKILEIFMVNPFELANRRSEKLDVCYMEKACALRTPLKSDLCAETFTIYYSNIKCTVLQD